MLEVSGNALEAKFLAYTNGQNIELDHFKLYKNDELHGPAFYYNAMGEIMLQGAYKNGKTFDQCKEIAESMNPDLIIQTLHSIFPCNSIFAGPKRGRPT